MQLSNSYQVFAVCFVLLHNFTCVFALKKLWEDSQEQVRGTHTPHFDAISKLSEGMFNPTVCVIDKDVNVYSQNNIRKYQHLDEILVIIL